MTDSFFNTWISDVVKEANEVVDEMFEDLNREDDKVIVGSYTYTGVKKGYIKMLKEMIGIKAWYDYKYTPYITHKTIINKTLNQTKYRIDIYLERRDEETSEDENEE